MIEILPLVNPAIIVETLQRIGIANKQERVLYPSCYLYIKNDKYYVCHFKELFGLKPGGEARMEETDNIRKNSIIFCLKNWSLIDINEKYIEPHNTKVFVLKRSEKPYWKIKHKIKWWTFPKQNLY